MEWFEDEEMLDEELGGPFETVEDVFEAYEESLEEWARKLHEVQEMRRNVANEMGAAYRYSLRTGQKEVVKRCRECYNMLTGQAVIIRSIIDLVDAIPDMDVDEKVKALRLLISELGAVKRVMEYVSKSLEKAWKAVRRLPIGLEKNLIARLVSEAKKVMPDIIKSLDDVLKGLRAMREDVISVKRRRLYRRPPRAKRL